MAGHSQFKNIMHRKGAQDAKRAKQFGKIIRELTVATRSGLPEPASNPRLRAAIVAAREVNMPKDTIERAIKKASGAAGSDDYVEIRYEGYGPAGVAVIVETLTDNRNRTASDVRAAFSKYGGRWAKPIPCPSCSAVWVLWSIRRRPPRKMTCLRPRSRPGLKTW